MKINIRSEVKDIAEEIISIRRDIHKHPELGFEVHRTAELVSKHLNNLGFEVSTGIGKTGVVGDLIGKNDGPTIGLRADMDALPIQEQNNFSYVSKNPGVMHACGHDGHTTILLAAAKKLSEKRLLNPC